MDSFFLGKQLWRPKPCRRMSKHCWYCLVTHIRENLLVSITTRAMAVERNFNFIILKVLRIFMTGKHRCSNV